MKTYYVYYKNPFNEIKHAPYEAVKNCDFLYYFDVKFYKTRDEAINHPDYIQIEKYRNP